LKKIIQESRKDRENCKKCFMIAAKTETTAGNYSEEKKTQGQLQEMIQDSIKDRENCRK
jgi:hypothetical protein